MKQQKVFEILTNKYQVSFLVLWMVKHLEISRPTAYKYIKCDRQMTYDQMVKLLNTNLIGTIPEFNNVDLIKQGAFWRYNAKVNSSTSPEDFLNVLNRQLALLSPGKDTITFVSAEVPIFYYMFFPRLISFKLFFWNKTIWEMNDNNLLFDHTTYQDDSYLQLYEGNCNYFSKIETIEFWSESMLLNTLNQINYARLMEWFTTPKTFKLLMDDVYSLVSFMEELVERGRKLFSDIGELGARSSILQNEVYFTNNTYFVTGKFDRIFTSLDNPNFIYTSDPTIINVCREWIRKMSRHSIPLTENSALNQKEFFDKLRDTVDQHIV